MKKDLQLKPTLNDFEASFKVRIHTEIMFAKKIAAFYFGVQMGNHSRSILWEGLFCPEQELS